MASKIHLGIAVLRSKTDAHLRKSQERYKHDYDKRVRDTPFFRQNDYVFVNNPSLRSTIDSNTEAISKQAFNKLRPRTAGPFRVIAVQKKTLTTNEHGTPQIVSIHRVTRAPDTANPTGHQLQKSPLHESPLPKKSRQKNTSQDQ